MRSEEMEGVRWEKFMPRKTMNVLLVESDGSTRQVISALLKKCSYTVSATSDGLKAWEMLKENPESIDLVLTEVELPSISGFTLLTMMMDHEACKNIPIIMMSSNDSMTMVFKFMLKGAADFLVKPLRKNELRNLWQHVWRKQISRCQDGVANHAHEDGNLEKRTDDQSRENVVCTQENKECSEKGSDAQSSCTRIEMEAESTYVQSIPDNVQPKGRDLSLSDDPVSQSGKHHILSNNGSLMQLGELEDKSTIFHREVDEIDGVCKLNDATPSGNPIKALEATYDDQTFKEAIDLIGGIDCQLHQSATASEASESLVTKHNSKSMPHLELSLRRYQQSSCSKTQNAESSALNRSVVSAFSQYGNRALVLSLGPATSDTESKECFTTRKASTDQGSNNTSNAPESPNVDREDSNYFAMERTSPEVTVHSLPLQVTPFAVSLGESASTTSSAVNGLIMQRIYYPQAAHRSWMTSPPVWQEAVNTNLSCQSSPKNIDYMQVDRQDDNSSKSVIHYHEQKQEESKELVKQDVSSLISGNGSNNTSNFITPQSNISGSGSSCDKSKGSTNESNLTEAKPESGNAESQVSLDGFRLNDPQRLNQREAALNKFRLKRKDRCFEKKVRYHSRQRLAEQRPRVKGQFVRHVQPDSQAL